MIITTRIRLGERNFFQSKKNSNNITSKKNVVEINLCQFRVCMYVCFVPFEGYVTPMPIYCIWFKKFFFLLFISSFNILFETKLNVCTFLRDRSVIGLAKKCCVFNDHVQCVCVYLCFPHSDEQDFSLRSFSVFFSFFNRNEEICVRDAHMCVSVYECVLGIIVDIDRPALQGCATQPPIVFQKKKKTQEG